MALASSVSTLQPRAQWAFSITWIADVHSPVDMQSRTHRLGQSGSERFPIMHTAVHDLVSQSLVSTLGKEVINERIRSHLDAVVIARPLLRRLNQFAAYSSLAKSLG